jgi:hypothetical protein
VAEHALPDRSRPDLAAFDASGSLQMLVEAKFGASLTVLQLTAYCDYLLAESQRQQATVVLGVLVPKARRQEALALAHGALPSARFVAEFSLAVADRLVLVVVTWDEVVDQLRGAVRDGSEIERSDAEQFASLVQTLEGLELAPLRAEHVAEQWESRKHDFIKLVDRVTVALTGKQRLMPMNHDGMFLQRRYVVLDGDQSANLAVGVRQPEATDSSPVWLRYHSRTIGFRNVLARIEASAYAPQIRRDGGHLWVPLQPLLDVGSGEIVSDLVEQVLQIDAIGRGSLALRQQEISALPDQALNELSTKLAAFDDEDFPFDTFFVSSR